jgi:hypothetical protein
LRAELSDQENATNEWHDPFPPFASSALGHL